MKTKTSLSLSVNGKFCHMRPATYTPMLIYKNNLGILKNATTMFEDGTFAYVSNISLQLYTVHVWKNWSFVHIVS
jgi:hypothetical protein